jgi:multidrug efflux pump subunit AcrB
MEADNMYATLTMPQGTTREHTEVIVQKIEQAAIEVQQNILDEGISDEPVYKNMATYIGSQPFSTQGGGPGGGGVAPAGGAHQAEINIELSNGEDRSVASRELARRWRDAVGEITGAQSLTFTSQLFSAGDPINVELSHRNFDVLIDAAERLKDILTDYTGVSEIADSFEPGKIELKLDMTDRGRTLGLTLDDLASQVRSGFYGQEVRRIQRGRDDIRVMLRYPESERNTIEDVRNMRMRLTDGTEIPFREVAHLEIGRGYAAINRADRRRIVSVTADVDESTANANEINQTLAATALPKLQQAYPGLSWSFQGEQKEQAETNASLARDLLIALLAIYGLLAVQFRSYIQPVIIMSAIPFGIIGAVIGHMIMGYNLSFLSFFGIVALTGVVVNDSLILIDLVNRRRKEAGVSLHDIVLEATQRRFRPILLTTLTTFLGLTPMLMEKSLQARFLIPMAISLSFGVLFATIITLFLVPALYMILEDIKRVLAFTFGRTDTLLAPQAEETSIPVDTVFDREVTREDKEEKVPSTVR